MLQPEGRKLEVSPETLERDILIKMQLVEDVEVNGLLSQSVLALRELADLRQK